MQRRTVAYGSLTLRRYRFSGRRLSDRRRSDQRNSINPSQESFKPKEHARQSNLTDGPCRALLAVESPRQLGLVLHPNTGYTGISLGTSREHLVQRNPLL